MRGRSGLGSGRLDSIPYAGRSARVVSERDYATCEGWERGGYVFARVDGKPEPTKTVAPQ